jgi:AhpD family alkylhydroperoxidase
MDPKNIDPAYEVMRDFAKHAHGTTAHIQKMRQDVIYADGAIPAKYKALAATLWSVSARCEPCIKYYALQAAKHGASEAEIGEMMAVASTMGACVAETWALKAFKAYKDGAVESHGTPDDLTCCR